MEQLTKGQLEIVMAAATIAVMSDPIHKTAGGFDTYVRVILPQQCANAVISIQELYAADNIQNIHIKYPLDWWEAVKERFAPAWALARWPVVYEERFIDIKAIWQGYKPKSDKYGPYLPYVYDRGGYYGTI